MHFIFPAASANPRQPDDLFADQVEAFEALGFSTSLCTDAAIAGEKPLRGIPSGSQVIYRGWMLNSEQYIALTEAILAADATPFTAPVEYLTTHHLPNWYPSISEYTPETRTYPVTADMVHELNLLKEQGWDAFFVKDYVKSLKTSVGSIIDRPEQIEKVLTEMAKFRGEIEGGICIRCVEDFLPETERRYFVLNDQIYAPDDNHAIPEIVPICASRIPSKFFSVDTIQRRDGTLRIVEIGDGQVSDRVGWSPIRFAEIFTSMI